MADEAFLQVWQNSLARKADAKPSAVQTLLNQLKTSYNSAMTTGTFTDNILLLNTMSLVLPTGGIAKDSRGKEYRIPAGSPPPYRRGLRVIKGTVGTLTDPKGNSLAVTYIGGGTYGEIWKSDTGRTFKRVVPQDEKSDEELARNFFCEGWIQTILSSDASYGMNVSKIIALYRDIGIVRRGGGVEGDKIFFIEMEYIPYAFSSLLDKDILTPDMLRGILVKIAEALLYFEQTYGFFHRDFHMGNLMMSSDGIKIIDFGMSCCSYDGKTYGMPGSDRVPSKVQRALGMGNQECASLDLFLFLMSIRDLFPDGPIAEYIDSITLIPGSETSGDPVPAYFLMVGFTTTNMPEGSSVWHSCYYYYYSDFDALPLSSTKKRPTILDAILSIDVFKPKECLEKLMRAYSVTGVNLSSYIPGLKYTRALFGKSVSPNTNVARAISTLSRGGKRTTRRRKTRRNRKH
jgi:hypothetical protein